MQCRASLESRTRLQSRCASTEAAQGQAVAPRVLPAVLAYTLCSSISGTLVSHVCGIMTLVRLFGGPAQVTADGVECHALEELREGEVLCISPETTSDIGRTSSGRRVFSAKLAKETHTADFTTYAILGTAAARDFEVLQAVGGGHNGFVFKSRCRLGGLPDPSALYALKMVYNFGVGADMARRAFQNEFRVLSQLPPHKRITRFWCQFVDESASCPRPHPHPHPPLRCVVHL